MILVPAAIPEHPPGRALPAEGRARRLIDPHHDERIRGGLTIEALPPGAATEPTGAVEAAVLVLAGRARWGERRFGPGTGLYHPAGSRHGLIADGSPAIVLTVHSGPAQRPDHPGYRSVPLVRRREQGALTEAGGFDGMGVHWLATSAAVGSRRLTVATSTFTPGGSHDLHRHPDADEFFLVLGGGGDHLTEKGRVRLGRGDLAYVPAGEWHGYRTRPGVTTTALYGYLGAGSLTQAGYQIKEETA